jgi:hypothetical protein
MFETEIKLVYCGISRTWTVVINGNSRDKLSSLAADELVELAMVQAELAGTPETICGLPN